MATKFFVKQDRGSFTLVQSSMKQSGKDCFEVQLTEEEVIIAKALASSQSIKTILEKCAGAGFLLHSKGAT